MSSKIRKRSGHQVDFDMQKIFTAVELAFESCGKKCPDTFRSILNQNTNKFKTAGTVEKIQDEIENLLLSCGYVKIYKHFATYRAQRAEYREKMKKQDFTSIISLEINDITTDNGNMNAQSPAGMMMKFASETTKQFSKDTLLAPDVLAAMNANRIYVHDLDYYPTRSLTCVQTPLNKVLNEGMVAGHGEIRGVKHIETAATVAMISLETSQNEMHGGQSIPAFDFYMAPYVRLAFIDELKRSRKQQVRIFQDYMISSWTTSNRSENTLLILPSNEQCAVSIRRWKVLSIMPTTSIRVVEIRWYSVQSTTARILPPRAV